MTRTLTPSVQPGPGQLDTAAKVLRERLNALGSKATVKVHGEALSVRATPSELAALRPVLSVGRLEVRQVLEIGGPGAGTEPGGQAYTAAVFARLGCTVPVDPARLAPAASDAVACSRDGAMTFHLGRPELGPTDIIGASAGRDATGTQAQVRIRFTSGGQDRWTSLTRKTFSSLPPTNQVAFVVDGVVFSAPVIQAVITGDADLSGSFTTAQAKELAAELGSGPLPFALQLQP